MKTKTMIASAAFSAMTATTAFAGKAAYDGFETADLGPLDEQIGGSGFDGPYVANASVTVVSRSLTYEKGDLKIVGGKQALQLKKSTVENTSLLSSRKLSDIHDEDVFYVSAIVYIDRNTRSFNNRDTFWVGLASDSSSRPGGGLGVEDTSYNWCGIVGGQGRLSGVAVVADSPHFIVAKIHKNTSGPENCYNRVSLMVDPESASEPSAWTKDNQTSGSSTTYPELGFLNFYMDYSRAETVDTFIIDEVRVGSTWADVVVPYVEPAADSDVIAHWTGADTEAKTWTQSGNWEDGVSPNSNDVVFDNDGTSASDDVTSAISVNTAVSSISFANVNLDGAESKRHTTSVAAGAVLSVAGTNAMGRAVSVTAQPLEANKMYNTQVALTGGGALAVESQEGEFLVGKGYSAPNNGRARGFLDLAGLASFTSDVSRLVLGEGIYTRGEMRLAATGDGVNFIRARYVGVGDSAGLLGGPETSVLTLGQENIIHADRVNIAATEVSGTKRNNCASGEMKFAEGLQNPSVIVRSRGGARRADMTIASHGDGGNNWYYLNGRADFSGGTVDMLLGELLVAAGAGYDGTQSGQVDGYFIMDAGIVDVERLCVGRTCIFDGGRKPDTHPAWGRYTMNGGVTLAGAVEAGVSTNGAWKGGFQCARGDIALSNDAVFTALGSVVLASNQGYATSTVARVTIADNAVFSACAGIRNGLRVEGRTESWGEIKIAEFDGSVFVNGGTLAVTNEARTSELCLDYGTLSVTGGSVVVDKLTMTNAQSVVALELSAGSTPISVKGAANVDGAKLVVSAAEGYAIPRNSRITIIEAGSLSGRFSEVVLPGNMKIRYSSNAVYGAFDGLCVIVR